jgi:hypothetical protein
MAIALASAGPIQIGSTLLPVLFPQNHDRCVGGPVEAQVRDGDFESSTPS